MNVENLPLIPFPVEVQISNGFFQIKETTIIYYQESCKSHAIYLEEFLQTAMNYKLPLQLADEKILTKTNIIFLQIQNNSTNPLPKEGYILKISPESIVLNGNDAAGCFYGIQTIRQLLSEKIESPIPISLDNFQWILPCLIIKDYPRFEWRGFMLDESRHFFGKVLVKRMIDLIALYKINKLHWHLTDDEGWRIESKKYPNLHTIGSKRLLSKRFKETPNLNNPHWYGGYYTQEEIKEIIAYANQHYIEVIPEIEMPGHATAPLVAYPEYSCETPPTIVPTIAQGNRHAYCAGNPLTYHFLQDILKEVTEIFPGDKIHIGGDELPTERWKKCPRCQSFMKTNNIPDLDLLQVHFAAENIKYLTSLQHQTIGWFDFPVDKLLEQGIDTQHLIFQFWVGSEKKMIDFVRKGGRAIVSNHRFMYLDYGYWKIDLKKAYSFDPIPIELESQYHTQILGLECPIWAEWVPNWQRMDFQVFPRICAYAETGWTPQQGKSYPMFLARLKEHLKRLDIMCVYYAPLSESTNSLKARLIPRQFRGGW